LAKHGGKSVKASVLLGRLQQDVRSLNSSILVITQKMKYLVRNEKILGRNLIVLNKKLRALEEKIVSGEIGPSGSANPAQVQELQASLDEANQKMAELQAQIQQISDNAASKEELQEMHYVVESINPLEFTTIEQVKDLIEGKKVKPRKPKKKD
jgi:vacuolar-type H+-ATPase subunit I/STV1